MSMLTEYKGRPTKDIDLLAEQISNDKESIRKVFSNICKIQIDDDGLVFNSNKIDVEDIKKDAEYQGVRVKLNCFLENAKNNCATRYWIWRHCCSRCTNNGMSCFIRYEVT